MKEKLILKFNTQIGEIYIIETDCLIKKSTPIIENFLSKKFNSKTIKLNHFTNGSPFLMNLESNISISHSKNFLAFYLTNDIKSGIDIEYKRNKILTGKDYFINKNEVQFFESMTCDIAHLIWGVKEAFYKRMIGKINDLKNELTIYKIDFETKLIEAKYIDKTLLFGFKLLNDELYLVYSLN